jgi:catechol 2,3-dioxygenase-like lactoylglutathione lyase family enzyme
MFFTKPLMNGASPVLNFDRRGDGLRFRRESTTSLQAYIARAFYCDVLQGREVWEEESGHDGGISFVVEGTRIDVGTSNMDDGEPLVLSVVDPGVVAERCWDAGYSVRVGDEDAGEAAVTVIDPFGRRINLVR